MSFARSFCPIHAICFVFGQLGPSAPSPGLLVRLLSLLCAALNLFALSGYVYFGLGRFPADAQSLSEFIIFFITLAHSAVDLLVLLFCLALRSRVGALLDGLAEVDLLLAGLGLPLDQRRLRRANFCIAALVQGLSGFIVCASATLLPAHLLRSPAVLFRLLYKQFYHQSFVLLLVAVLFAVRWRFSALNEALRALLLSDAEPVQGKRRDAVRTLASVHGRLSAALASAGRLFAVPTVCYVGLYLALLLLSLYQLFESLQGVGLATTTVLDLLALFKLAAFFAMLTAACSRVDVEVRHATGGGAAKT